MRADFDRVYSPPEPPSSRRRKVGTALGVLAVLALAGGAVVTVPKLGGGGAEPGARPSAAAGPESTTPSAGPSLQEPPVDDPSAPSPSAQPSESTSGASSTSGLVERLPKICGTVAKATFLKWVPKGTLEEWGGERGGSCGASTPAGQPFRYLRLETRIGNASNDIDPLSIAKWSFGQDLQAQQKDTSSRTIVVSARPGLGEEAFQRFSVNKGEPTVTARVEARVHNVIVTVTYNRAFSGKPEKEQESSLDVAASVVAEALKEYA